MSKYGEKQGTENAPQGCSLLISIKDILWSGNRHRLRLFIAGCMKEEWFALCRLLAHKRCCCRCLMWMGLERVNIVQCN